MICPPKPRYETGNWRVYNHALKRWGPLRSIEGLHHLMDSAEIKLEAEGHGTHTSTAAPNTALIMVLRLVADQASRLRILIAVDKKYLELRRVKVTLSVIGIHRS